MLKRRSLLIESNMMRRLLIRIFRAGVTGGTSFGGQKGESYQIDRVSKFQYKSILSESTGKTRIGRLEEWKGGRLPLSGHSSGQMTKLP